MPQTIEEHMEELQEEGGIEFSCRSSLSSRDGSQADEEYHVRYLFDLVRLCFLDFCGTNLFFILCLIASLTFILID